MASLTETLNQPTSGKGMTNAPKPGPSIFSAIAEPISGFIGGMDDRDRYKARKASEMREAEADARAEGGIAASNAAAAFETSLRQKIGKLTKVQTAASQGRVNYGAVDMERDAGLQELFTQYPEYKADIMKQYKTSGFTSVLFREQEALDKQNEAVDASIVSRNNDYRNLAVNHGLDPNGSDESLITAGRIIAIEDDRLKRAREADAAERAAAAEGRAVAAAAKPEREEEMFGATVNKLNVTVTSMREQIDGFITAAGTDAERQARLNEVVPQIGLSIQRERQKALNDLGSSASKELVDRINTTFDDLQKQVTDSFTGDLSYIKSAQRTQEIFKTEFKMNAGQSMKAYSGLAEMFGGTQVLNSIFADGKIPFNDGVKKQIEQELRGFNTSDAKVGKEHLLNAARLIKGEAKLQDLTAEQAVVQMPAMAATVTGSQVEILRGSKDPATLSAFGNAYNVLTDAALSVQPGRRDVTGLWAGTRIFASPGARTALEALVANPETRDQGVLAIQGSRLAATQALVVARQANTTKGTFNDATPLKPSPTQNLVFGLNPATGKNEYFIQFDERAFEKASSKFQYPATAGPEERKKIDAQRRINDQKLEPSTRDRISIMNASLEHLVETAKYDESIPKDATQKQIREHYGRGTPYVTVKGKRMLTSDEAFDEAIDKWEGDLKNENASPYPVRSDIKFANGRDALVRTLIIEAGNESDDGIAAAASVILNRAQGNVDAIESVVLKNNGRTWQFTAWGDPKARTKGLQIDPESPKYKKIAALVETLITNERPRMGFVNYINKDLQLANGDKIPDWAQGKGTKIGNHTFY
jgi:hypothetical protein